MVTYLGGAHFVRTWMVHEVAVVVEPGCTSCLPANVGFEESAAYGVLRQESALAGHSHERGNGF
jgi:hypothetical protein